MWAVAWALVGLCKLPQFIPFEPARIITPTGWRTTEDLSPNERRTVAPFVDVCDRAAFASDTFLPIYCGFTEREGIALTDNGLREYGQRTFEQERKHAVDMELLGVEASVVDIDGVSVGRIVDEARAGQNDVDMEQDLIPFGRHTIVVLIYSAAGSAPPRQTIDSALAHTARNNIKN